MISVDKNIIMFCPSVQLIVSGHILLVSVEYVTLVFQFDMYRHFENIHLHKSVYITSVWHQTNVIHSYFGLNLFESGCDFASVKFPLCE